MMNPTACNHPAAQLMSSDAGLRVARGASTIGSYRTAIACQADTAARTANTASLRSRMTLAAAAEVGRWDSSCPPCSPILLNACESAMILACLCCFLIFQINTWLRIFSAAAIYFPENFLFFGYGSANGSAAAKETREKAGANISGGRQQVRETRATYGMLKGLQHAQLVVDRMVFENAGPICNSAS